MYCTPEIKLLGNHRGFCQWHAPMDVQWHVPTQLHLSEVGSKHIVTRPVGFHWNCPTDVHSPFPTEFHFRDFWCAICSPDPGPRPGPGMDILPRRYCC